MRPRTALTSILLAGTVAASLAIAPTVASASPPQAPPPAAASVVPAAPTADGERVVLSEDFSGGMPSGWRPVEGTWAVVDGRLRGTGKGGMLSRITFGPHLEAYRLEATVRFDSVENTSRWAALGLDLAADGSVPWWIATMRSNTVAPNGLEFAERTASNAWNVTDTAAAPTAAGTGRDVKVRVEVRGSRAAWFFDGTKVMETRHLVRSTDGGLGLLLSGAVVSFDDVTVTEIPNTADSLLRQPGEDMAVIAHRGYSQVAPEDTMASYESAARAGADFLENDVQSTADGVPMILHDDTLDRTTDHTGRLDAAQSADVRTLDAGSWFSRYFTGQRVPTSVEMLQHAKAKGRQVLLEIKGPETRPEIERIVREVGETAMKESTVIQSLRPGDPAHRARHRPDPAARPAAQHAGRRPRGCRAQRLRVDVQPGVGRARGAPGRRGRAPRGRDRRPAVDRRRPTPVGRHGPDGRRRCHHQPGRGPHRLAGGPGRTGEADRRVRRPCRGGRA